MWPRYRWDQSHIASTVARRPVTPVPPATLLGVAALDVPDHLVEIEATAVVD